MLDPVFALRSRVTVPAGRSAEVTFTTFFADDREQAMQLADLYHDPYSSRRALDLSWAHAQAELRELGITPADAALYQELAGHLLYENPGFKGLPSRSADNKLGQAELWGLGISGDWPILLATLTTADGLPSVRQLLKVHHYWRTKGIISDLVILNEHPPTYLQELSEELLSTVMASGEAGLLDKPGGVFIRRADLLNPADVTLLNSLARIQVDCDGLGLGNFLERDTELPTTPTLDELLAGDGHDRSTTSPALGNPSLVQESPAVSEQPESHGLAFYNGIGGFNDQNEYEIRLAGNNLPPARGGRWSGTRGGFMPRFRTGVLAANSYFSAPPGITSFRISRRMYLPPARNKAGLWTVTPIDRHPTRTGETGAGTRSLITIITERDDTCAECLNGSGEIRL